MKFSPTFWLTIISAVRGLAFLSLIISAHGAKTEASTDWAGDLAYLRRELPARHPNLFFQTTRSTFEAELDTLTEASPTLNDAEIALRLRELLVKMGDDHTTVGEPKTEAMEPPLPLNLYWFKDGWRIIGADRDHRALLGRKLTAIGSVPMPEAEARLARLISSHPPVVKSRLPGVLIAPASLRHCGLAANDTVTLTTENDAGTSSETKMALDRKATRERQDLVKFEPTAIPYGFTNQRAILWTKLMPKSRIVYVQYNRCEGREVAVRLGATPEEAAKLPSLEEALDKAEAQLRASLAKGEADRFIIDLRFNPGGASDFGTRFAEKVARLPELKEPGRIFVIIGRRTFSSAIINAGDFKRLTGAILVGEPTSGTPNHYGQTTQFTLPSSGLVVTHSTKYFGEPGAPFEPLRPDLPAEMSFGQFAKGSDPAIGAIMDYLKNQAAAPAAHQAGP